MAGIRQVKGKAVKKDTTSETVDRAAKSRPKRTVAASKEDAPKPATTATTKKASTKSTKSSSTAKNTPKITNTKSRQTSKMTKRASKTAADNADDSAVSINGESKKTIGRRTKAQSTATATKPVSRKRKASDEPDDATTATVTAPTKKIKLHKKGPVINKVPTTVLQCFVFGEGANAELGLGTRNRDRDVKRPRLNPNLDKLGIVTIAAGGMHTLALTHDNKIVTWGVNDQGTLGRSTEWSGGLRDMDADKDDSDDDDDLDAESGLNPLEATPTAIPSDAFPEDTVFAQVAAGDSCSFALTDDGQVYGWGTFRSDDGILGFSPTVECQRTPKLMPTLHSIVKISCGQNHVLALDSHGSVFAWGSGQQAQIGRKILERHRLAGLTPGEFGLPRKQIVDIAAGANHSFAIDKKDRVWTWGLNSFGQTGIDAGAGEDSAFVSTPSVVECLSKQNVKYVTGGGLHSMAINADGKCMTWGRIDNNQLGVPVSDMREEDIIKGETGQPRILTKPTLVKAIADDVADVGLGADHCLVVTKAGKAYAWGFSVNYQTGLGTDDDVITPTMIDNTAVREKKLVGAYAGGQFGILTAAVGQ